MQSYIFEFVHGTNMVRMIQDDDGMFRVYLEDLCIATLFHREDATHVFNNEVQKLTTRWEREVS